LLFINEELLASGDVSTSRSTRKITFKLPDDVTYVAGDHLTVHPLNSLDKVIRFGTCFEEELGVAAESSGRRPTDGNLIVWQLQQPMAVETTEDGVTISALLAFQIPWVLPYSLLSTFPSTNLVSIRTCR
jgi:hypothetical protein